MFEMNPTLVEVFGEPPRPLTIRLIDGWADRVHALPTMDAPRYQAVTNYVQAVGRLIHKSEQLGERVRFFSTSSSGSTPTPVDQHEVHDLYESYFQGLYKTLSSLAAVTVLFPSVFHNPPVRRMKKFLEAMAVAYPDVQEACGHLEEARQYRTLLDHPAGAAVSNWMTFQTADGRGLRVIFYGYKSRSGGIPEGAERITYPFLTDADWLFDTPFVPYTNQALGDLTAELFTKLMEESA